MLSGGITHERDFLQVITHATNVVLLPAGPQTGLATISARLLMIFQVRSRLSYKTSSM